MPPTATELAANRLLAASPQRELGRLRADVRLVELVDAEILSEPGSRTRHVHFPVAGCISLSNPPGEHSGLEVGLIGDEGMSGATFVLGADVASLRATVHGTGAALRIDAAPFRRHLQQCPGLRRVLERYIQVLMRQLAQSTVCCRFHRLEARLARLLLMVCERAHFGSFHLTHAVLARRLGVRRAGVSAAGELRHGGSWRAEVSAVTPAPRARACRRF